MIQATAPGVMRAPGCTCFKLRSLARRVTQLYDQALAPAGLTVTQYSLIATARRRAKVAPPAVGELAQALVTDRTTLTRNLKPLIDAGYLELRPGVDGRSKAVIVTAHGEAAYRAARPLWKLAQAAMEARAGARRIADIHTLVDGVLPLLGPIDDRLDD